MSKLYNFEIKVEIDTKSGKLTYLYGKQEDALEIHFTVPFSSDPEKNISEVTIYNINPSDFNRIQKGDKVRLYAGFHGDVGLLVSGTIYRSTIPTLDDADTAYVLRILEGQDYTRLPKLNLTFKNNTTASTIIQSVVSKSGINLSNVSLKTNKVYKDGYTADDHPLAILSEVADDCKTSLFYLRGQLTLRYIYDGKAADSFNLSYDTGLLQSPTREDRDDDWIEDDDDDGLGRQSWSIDSILNYHLTTFAKVKIDTVYAKQTVMISSGEHDFDGDEPTTTLEGVQQ